MKNIIKSINMGIIMLFVFGGILIWTSFPNAVVGLKPAVSFDDLLDEDIELKSGMHISGQVPYVLDYFATESTYTQYNNGSRTGDRANGRYYLVPTYDGFIAMKGAQKDVDVLDDLIDETWIYLMDGTEPTTEYSMDGVTEVLDDYKLAQYFNEYIEDMGYTEEEIAEMGDPLLVHTVSFMACWIMLAIGIVLLVLGILLFRKCYRRTKYGSGLSKAEDLPNVPVHTTAKPFEGADD